MQDQIQNQTEFSSMEPMYEDVYNPVQPPSPNLDDSADDLETEQKKKRKKMIFIAIAVAIFLVLILGFVLILLSSQTGQETQELVDEVKQTDNIPVSSYERELQVIEDRLSEIDPVIDSVTVPPVDYTLRLE